MTAKLARETRILDTAAKEFDKDVTPEEVAQVLVETRSIIENSSKTDDMTDEEEVEFCRSFYARMKGAGYRSD